MDQSRSTYLDAVLKAVELEIDSVSIDIRLRPLSVWLYRWLWEKGSNTSQQEFAIWQPAWPTVPRELVKCLILSAGEGHHTVQTDDFSHVDGWI